MALCLASLVLNNAYKSENVTKMIASRSLLPCQNLDQLYKDNLSVYTLVSVVAIHDHIKHDSAKPLVKNHLVTLYWRNHPIEIVSEMFRTTFHFQANRLTRQTDINVLLNATLHPIVETLVSTITHYLEKIWNKPTKVPYENLTAQLLRQYEETMINSVKNCSGSAVVAPTYVAAKYARTLTSIDNFTKVKYVDISEETYFQAFQTFVFAGNVPMFTLKRFKAIKSSLIFNWYYNFVFQTTMVVIDKSEPYRAPSIKGNIFVVCALLLVGQALSILVLLFERLLIIQYEYFFKVVKVNCLKIVMFFKRTRVKRFKIK